MMPKTWREYQDRLYAEREAWRKIRCVLPTAAIVCGCVYLLWWLCV